MIKPTKPIETYKQYGFKKCKGEYGKNHWIYDDPRIHKNANCRYKDNRTAIEIICEMAMGGLVKVE